MSDYLFKSRKGNNRHIGRVQAYRVLNDVAELIGLEEIGTHTLRKTFRLSFLQKNERCSNATKII